MGLKLPKLDERPPFQTYIQIARQVDLGHLTTTEAAELWDCLYLSSEEINALLAVIKEANQRPTDNPHGAHDCPSEESD